VGRAPPAPPRGKPVQASLVAEHAHAEAAVRDLRKAPPIAPTPTMPSVMPAISRVPAPSARALSQMSLRRALVIASTLRASTSIAMAQYSATDCALPPEMLEIITPRAVASASGTRSVPCVDRDRAHARRGRKKIVRQLAAPDEAVGFAREAPDRLGIAIRCADDLHRGQGRSTPAGAMESTIRTRCTN